VYRKIMGLMGQQAFSAVGMQRKESHDCKKNMGQSWDSWDSMPIRIAQESHDGRQKHGTAFCSALLPKTTAFRFYLSHDDPKTWDRLSAQQDGAKRGAVP
jgi:hypothetical protein